MNIAATYKELSRSAGLSGRERPVAERCLNLLRPYVDAAEIDAWGNVIGVKRCGRPDAPVLMFDAHIDQVGFFVTGPAGDGYFYLGETGMDMRFAPGLPVRVFTRDGQELPGLITCGAGEASGKAVPGEKLYLDTGLPQAEAERLIHKGDPVLCDCAPYELPGGLMYGPAADDRACFLALLLLMEKLQGQKLKTDIVIQGACREEIGGPSAGNSVERIKPDLFFAVDTCHAKTPDHPKGEELYRGPAIARQGTSDSRVSRRLFELAEAYNIPHQEYVISYISGTNAGEVQIRGKGYPCGVVSLPIRYMHAPYEVCCLDDLKSLGELLYRFACDFRGLGKEGA
jgi:endoglucanase